MNLDLIDVFCNGPLSGNPLGVVHGGEGLTTQQMQAITCWLGYSETTFLLPPTDPAADYRVRIFYPAGELPFAGHPTLGSAHGWLAAGGVPKGTGRIVQECGVGLIEVRQQGERLAFRAPPLIRTGALSADELAEALRVSGADPDHVVEAVHVANGPNWVLLRMDSAEAVLAAEPAAKAAPGTDVGLAGPCVPGSEADWELRAFFAKGAGDMAEDPVTGSFNAGVAMHLFETGLVKDSYIAAQGRKTGANGLVYANNEADGVWIGGRVATVSAGGELFAP
ncbi:PhzF family phenazine biosynthesis protein [Novosphingobium aquae]|uniref:PhzF family phenazine biosynthesis protein n=1 Tax=Novosphingobium aquae TaxID=3133435 RepID=A0ABU8S6H0_9SPHN